MTQLSGKQIGAFIDALLDAYPARDDLRIMVRIELEETLEAIADGANQRVVVFNLVTWAERSGRLDDLVAGAVKQNPGNPALLALNLTQSPANAMQIRPTPPASSGPAAIDVFLSYSRQNLDAMRVVEATLRDAGLSVWTDEGLAAGTPSWTAAIEEALGQAPAMVVLLSPAAKASVWVENEVALAQRKGKRIYPLLVDGDEDSAVLFRLISVQWVDGRLALGEAVQRVLAQMGASGLAAAPVPTAAPDWHQLRAIMQDRHYPVKERLDAGLQLSDLGVLPEGLDDFIAVPGTDFHIAKYPVTNFQYRRFVEAGGYGETGGKQPPWWSAEGWKERQKRDMTTPRLWDNAKFNWATQPVVGVSWYEADAYCAWLNHTASHEHLPDGERYLPTGCRAQLPTQEQWMLAARNGRRQAPAEEEDYPWGNIFDLALVNAKESGLEQPTPVDMYPDGATPSGVYDLAGNVWEWTSDRHEGSVGYWRKGGAWWHDASRASASAADWTDAYHWRAYYSFRVAVVRISRSA